MTTWDLSRLRYTVRKLTGKFDVNQLPDTSPLSGQVSVQNPPGVDDYINDYYLYDMPEDLRTLKLRDFYTFSTIPNCGTYSLPQTIYDVYPPIYVDNYQFNWYQYPNEFYQVWPELNFINQFPADSTTATQTFTLSQTPIQQGTLVIGLIPNQTTFTAFETFRDADSPVPLDIPIQQVFNNPGVLTGSFGGTGTINYLTGAVSVTYANGAPPAGSTITAHYHPYVASRPRDILFWQQQLFIRPIPNDIYLVKVMAYMMPTTVLSAATNATVFPASTVLQPGTTNTSPPAVDTVTITGFAGSPAAPAGMTNLSSMNEFWQLISYGAAIKILTEEGDWTEVAALQTIYEKQKNLAQRRTLRQLAHQRIPTVYSTNGGRSDTWPIFPMY